MSDSPRPTAHLATGIRWWDGLPHLVLTDPDTADSATTATATATATADEQSLQPLTPGTITGWHFDGPRECVGIRRKAGRRVPCPRRTALPETAARSQCDACALADPGRKLARDQAMDDPRPFSLYLAWFGPGLLKVGLTATERRAARLADQGAPMFTWLAHGPLIPIRSTERACSATGLVRERLPHKAKVAAWWQPRPTGDPQELADVHARLTPLLPESLTPAPCRIENLTRFYGLTEPPPLTPSQA
ncbi:DUF2797 domain-containing protein, partial [Streptomyces sp. SID3343]|uniref:DUF2797 domain-containing protein n=1 Tax=Streptomyces sp. SID3343 TaxID=2690260 RepID=UPI0013BFE6FD